MKMFNFKVAIVSSILMFTLSVSTWAGNSDLDERTSNLWLKSKLYTTYTLNEHLSPFDIGVNVEDGVAVLSGKVDTGIEKFLAADIARKTKGIKKVKNNIRIVPFSSSLKEEKISNKDRYGFTTSVENANMVARVKYNLLWNKKTNGLDIEVDSKAGRIIILSGTVSSENEKSAAVDAAEDTSGVTSVIDNISVDRNKKSMSEKLVDVKDTVSEKMDDASDMMGETMEETGTAFADKWITAKVKSRLLFDKVTDGLDIDVDTQKGVVTLKGLVSSKEEEKRAMNLVNGMDGVKNVVNQLKIYLPNS